MAFVRADQEVKGARKDLGALMVWCDSCFSGNWPRYCASFYRAVRGLGGHTSDEVKRVDPQRVWSALERIMWWICRQITFAIACVTPFMA